MKLKRVVSYIAELFVKYNLFNLSTVLIYKLFQSAVCFFVHTCGKCHKIQAMAAKK